jgi:Icc protein
MPGSLLLAQLSDLHFRADARDHVLGVDPARALESVLAALPARPEILVLTGDLADDGSLAAYRRIDALTAEVAPRRYVVPGNHDDPAALAQVFGPVPAVSMEHLSDAWSLALVDTFRPGRIGGRVRAASVRRLDELLTGQPNVVVALHHPLRPPCGYPECSFEGADLLEPVLAEHAVRVVISGHLHRYFELGSDGMRTFGAPSTLRGLGHRVGDPHWVPDDGPVGGALLTLHDSGACEPIPIMVTVAAGVGRDP